MLLANRSCGLSSCQHCHTEGKARAQVLTNTSSAKQNSKQPNKAQDLQDKAQDKAQELQGKTRRKLSAVKLRQRQRRCLWQAEEQLHCAFAYACLVHAVHVRNFGACAALVWWLQIVTVTTNMTIYPGPCWKMSAAGYLVVQRI